MLNLVGHNQEEVGYVSSPIEINGGRQSQLTHPIDLNRA